MENQKTTRIILFSLLAISTFTFNRSCVSASRVDKLQKNVEVLETKLSKVDSQLVNENALREIINTTPAWENLRLEEISDKEKISINALRSKTTN